MLPQRRFGRSNVLFIGLILISFVMTTIDVRGGREGVGEAVRETAQSVFSPLQKLVDAVTNPIVGFVDGVSNLATLRSENEELRDEITRLEQQVAQTEQLEARLSELEKINALDPPGEIQTVTARVFAAGVSNFDLIRVIDKGEADGVAKGMAVVDERGLVGRIVEVSNNSAKVRLITDPLSRVGVRVLRTGETGFVQGQGGGALKLEMDRASEGVQEGDRLITAGGRFPPDLSVATVAKDASAEAGFTLRSTADPLVEFGRLDFVKILLTTAGDEPLTTEDDTDRIPVEGEPPGDGTTTTEGTAP